MCNSFFNTWLPILLGLTMSTAFSGCGNGPSNTGGPDGFMDQGQSADSPTPGDPATGDNAWKPDNDIVDAALEEEATKPACLPRQPIVPIEDFFTDVSDASGIRTGNLVADPTKKIPINDHSRLAFADINGDGWDDIVMHSLFPNPQAGIPFQHLVFLNNGDGTFTDFSDESGLRDVQAGFFAFGDIDNDGDQDVFAGLDIPLGNQTSTVLLNDGTGRFTTLSGSGVDAPGVPTVAGNSVFADFDGDGVLDLFVGNGHTAYAAQDALYMGVGDGSFIAAFTNLKGNPKQPTNGCVTCDYDNDGDIDIIVSTYGVSTGLGLNILWENDGSGVFTNVAVERGFAGLATGNYWLSSTGNGTTPEPGKGPGTYMGSNGFGLDCGDVNNDGLMDIYLTAISHPVTFDYSRKWSDPSQLLINLGKDGGWAFANEFLDRGLPFNEGDIDGAMIDFDNDGRLDLSVSREKKYEGGYTEVDQKAWFGLMRQLDDGHFQSMGPQSGINVLDAEPSASLTKCTSDAECPEDGEKCLLSRCRRPCSSDADCPDPNEICGYYWNGDKGANDAFCKPLVTMKMAQNHAWSDIDHDGDLDLLVGGRDTGGGRPNFLFRNDIGSKNRWLAVRLAGDGDKVNRDAIGTRVSLVYPDRTLVREVGSSRGMYDSADTRVLHFGLGGLGCDYEMHVRWPDGTKRTFKPDQYPEDSFIRIAYPDDLQVE
ncbi:MAG: CRTAC1 family protein [Deltaproteobacteria bacterium]|nr:CRTAC1 family protein [Deltaproteobacteria bacterium]